MSMDLCETGKPMLILTKEYEEKPAVDKLFDIFMVSYKEDIPDWKRKTPDDESELMRYLFFTDLNRAVKRWKLFGPRVAMLKRILTDSEELLEKANKNNHLDIEVSSDSDEEEEKTTEIVV
jgi:hypothetical protein